MRCSLKAGFCLFFGGSGVDHVLIGPCQEVVDAIAAMVLSLLKHPFEPYFGVEVTHFSGLNQGVGGGR